MLVSTLPLCDEVCVPGGGVTESVQRWQRVIHYLIYSASKQKQHEQQHRSAYYDLDSYTAATHGCICSWTKDHCPFEGTLGIESSTGGLGSIAS